MGSCRNVPWHGTIAGAPIQKRHQVCTDCALLRSPGRIYVDPELRKLVLHRDLYVRVLYRGSFTRSMVPVDCKTITHITGVTEVTEYDWKAGQFDVS